MPELELLALVPELELDVVVDVPLPLVELPALELEAAVALELEAVVLELEAVVPVLEVEPPVVFGVVDGLLLLLQPATVAAAVRKVARTMRVTEGILIAISS